MLSKFILLIVSAALASGQQAENSDALRECGNLHHLEFRNLPNARAEFVNSACVLKCSVDDRVLSNDAINEGFPCPADANGICHQGQCQLTSTGAQIEALRECGNLHHIDFHSGRIGYGSGYLNSQCTLKCVLNNAVVSENVVNEGYPCPADSAKVCRAGQCIVAPVTLLPPTTVTITPSTSSPHSDTTPKPPSPLAAYNWGEIHLNLMQAQLQYAHQSFQAEACIAPGTIPGSRPQCRTAICATPPETRTTNWPQWSHECLLSPPYADNDEIIVNVFDHNSANQAELIGTVMLNMRLFLEYNFPKEPLQNLKNPEYSFTQSYGLFKDGSSKGDITLGFRVTLHNKN